jgi:hypothetical protein
MQNAVSVDGSWNFVLGLGISLRTISSTPLKFSPTGRPRFVKGFALTSCMEANMINSFRVHYLEHPSSPLPPHLTALYLALAIALSEAASATATARTTATTSTSTAAIFCRALVGMGWVVWFLGE